MTDVGALGLPFEQVGKVVQALGEELLNRENVTREQVIAYLTSEAFDEPGFWERFGGPALDFIEDAITEEDEFAVERARRQMGVRSMREA